MNRLWGVILVSALYVAAFGVFGWKIVRRKPGPSFGWALLGGLARWMSDILLTIAFLLMAARGLPFVLVLTFVAFLRFVIWATLATMLYQPIRKHTIHFAAIMTLVNFGIDLLCFGSPESGELWKPINMGSYH